MQSGIHGIMATDSRIMVDLSTGWRTRVVPGRNPLCGKLAPMAFLPPAFVSFPCLGGNGQDHSPIRFSGGVDARHGIHDSGLRGSFAERRFGGMEYGNEIFVPLVSLFGKAVSSGNGFDESGFPSRSMAAAEFLPYSTLNSGISARYSLSIMWHWARMMPRRLTAGSRQ